MLIYGISFVVYNALIVVLFFVLEGLAIGLSIFGAVGALIINPIVVGVLSDEARQYDTDTKNRPLGLYAFLLGLLGVVILFFAYGAAIIGIL